MAVEMAPYGLRGYEIGLAGPEEGPGELSEGRGGRAGHRWRLPGHTAQGLGAAPGRPAGHREGPEAALGLHRARALNDQEKIAKGSEDGV